MVKDDCQQCDLDIYQATKVTRHRFSMDEPHEAVYVCIRIATAIRQLSRH